MEFRRSLLEGVVMKRSFWKNKRVFITGVSGFKGSWLASWLKNCGADVCGYSLPSPTKPALFELLGLRDSIRFVEGDVRNAVSLADTMSDFAPEIVFHLAAQPLVRASYIEPVDTFETNVMGTVNILEAARDIPELRSVVVITTDKCYENREWLWGYREDDAMGGDDPYSASKGCAELVTASYRKSFFSEKSRGHSTKGIASVRAGNVIGGGDWSEDRLIPDCIRAFARRENVIIRRPDSIRPWQHVLDPLNGYLTLAEALWDNPTKYSEGWNFGPHSFPMTVGEVVSRTAQLWGDGANWLHQNDGGPHEASLLQLDCSKANHRLNWKPRLSAAAALSWTVHWYKACTNGEDVTRLTETQISTFEGI